MEKMSPTERRAVSSLASIMSLRLLGLFMILPVFALYAHDLAGSTPILIGVAMGVYGLTQALFQIPFGMISDHVGRKPVIAVGLLIFIAGSIISALSHSIYWMILGRALQGSGAVGSTIIAMIADFTRPEQRSKAMAILFFVVPIPVKASWHSDVEPKSTQFFDLLKEPQLARLNLGVLILHAIFTASFVVIPISLKKFAGIAANHQWSLYVPALLLAFVASIFMIMIAEKKHQLKAFFLSGIIILGMAELVLSFFAHSVLLSAAGLMLFFTAFSLLEAFLPSWITRSAPKTRRGTALGIYSCAQFLGIFIGGTVGGWLYGVFGLLHVYLFCVALTLLWLPVATGMKSPPH